MKKKLLILVSVLAIIVLCVWKVGDRVLRKRGFAGTGEFVSQLLGNYPKSFESEPLTLKISVDDESYAKLEHVVAKARERGVIMPEGNDYIKARVASGDNEFKAKLRIKGKLTDHVKGDKWSFRIIGRKGGMFNGMQRFSLQHPGTRNYLYEWLYHRIMEREGVIALKYGFVDVELNDEPLGIYAYEEHFGQELLQHNKRPEGPIFRFDPGLYWIHRLSEMNGLRFREAYADHHAAMLDTYDSGEVFKSEKRTEEFRKALLLMNGLRSGMLGASEVFDTERIALRHAVIDLIGGHHSMDWSDIKFYYNPLRNLIEPVSYESFSVRPLEQLAGSFRYTGKQTSRREIHDIFFSDEQLFREYIAALERVSSKPFLDSLFNELGTELDSVSAIIYKEFPFKPLKTELYYKNAEVIRATLDFPQGAHAFVSTDGESTSLQFVPISDLPIEVRAIVHEGNVIPDFNGAVVPSRHQGHLGDPITVSISIPDSLLNYRKLKFEWSVLGSEKVKQSGFVPMDYPDRTELQDFAERRGSLGPVQGLLNTIPEDLYVDSMNQQILMTNSTLTTDRDLVIPPGYELLLSQGTKLTFTDANLLIFGTINAKGAKVSFFGDSRFILESPSKWKDENKIANCEFNFDRTGTGTACVIRGSAVSLSDVRIKGDSLHDLLLAESSDCVFREMVLDGGRDLLTSYYSSLSGSVHGRNATDDGIRIFAGRSKGTFNVVMENAQDNAIILDGNAQVSSSNIDIRKARRGLSVKIGSQLTVESIKVSDCEVGLRTDKASVEYRSRIAVENATFENVTEHMVQGKGSTILINGQGNTSQSE